MPYRKSKDDIHAGMIMMWSGLISDIPSGWSICDGTNGTPDLQDKFVRGASAEVGTSGGCNSHYHVMTTNMGCVIGGCNAYVMVEPGCTVAATGLSHMHTLNVYSDVTSNIPPFYELIFIRKD